MKKGRKQARGQRESNQLVRERSRKQIQKTRGKLNEILSLTGDEAFIQLAWAVDALQSGREAAAGELIQYPKEAVTTDLSAKFHIHKWELETLVNELLTIPKRPLAPGPNRLINCNMFGAMAHMAGLLRRLENAESGITLQRMSVLVEMHRISQRQFEWQRGFWNAAQLYRWAYIFGGPICGDYFKATHNLTIPDFMLAGFAIMASLASRPVLLSRSDFSEIGLGSAARDAALKLIVATHVEARRQATIMRLQGRGAAYEPSVLRQKPVIEFAERLRAPLPMLIMNRVTAGIYYDVVRGPSDVPREIGARFEAYALDLFASLPGAVVKPSYNYGTGRRPIDTPDLLLMAPGRPTLPIECKAKKMTIQARYGEDPVVEAAAGYDEIAKGVFQLWRFFAHARQGLHGEDVQRAPAGIVLTLDSWLSMAGVLRDEVIRRAEALAACDSSITEDDRKPIVFCSVEDLELALAEADMDIFVAAVSAAATDPTYLGWSLPNVLQKNSTQTIDNPYPFNEKIGELLPWWAALEARAQARA